MKKRVAIIGSGNIGTDLLFKVQKSDELECSLFIGRNKDSKGISLAQKMGVKTSIKSIDAIIENHSDYSIVFDATTAESHKRHSEVFSELGITAIDLTPAKVGKMCVPVINLDECLGEKNVNMITCAGQAAIPIAYEISQFVGNDNIKYMEIVASIASKSAGKGTRNNIDEFTQTTKDALSQFTGIKNTKAVIILNPAIPEINMRNTLYCYIDNPDIDLIKEKVKDKVLKIQQYVPGYNLIVEPFWENGRITTTIEVIGSGDYLPKYAGNLDIITSAAIEVAKNI